jgi:DNA repair protein SbcD/Mre11
LAGGCAIPYSARVRILHAADLHLDSPLRDLGRYEGAPVDRIRDASRRALENLVTLCLEESVELVLFAGDLFDGEWRDYRTGLFFCAQMSRLRAAAIPVVFIRGNHDAASRLTKQLALPDNVVELPTDVPGRHVIERIGVAVHGQGFARTQVVDDLAARFPAPLAGLVNIGLLHTSADGRPGHAPYAPTRVATLVDRGYDYWALGHVHKREELWADPPVVFPGNLQGRHAREVGAKGATLVHVEGGRVVRTEHRALDVVRWDRCYVDAGAAHGPDEVIALCRASLEEAVRRAEDRPLAARVILSGVTPADAALRGSMPRWIDEIRQQANDIGEGAVWIERVVLETRVPIDLDAVALRDDAVGNLASSLRRLGADDAALRELARSLDDLRAKLPRELQEGEDAVLLDDPDALRAALRDVERFLVPRLVGGPVR